MNPVGELLEREDIALDLEVSTGNALLRKIAAMLARRARLGEQDVMDALTSREELGSTALGHGIAIPHARLAQCGAAAAAFVRTRTSIPFAAPDGKPVSLFLGLIVPKQADERHLKLLATAAGMFSDRLFRDKLRAAIDPAQALEVLAVWPDASEERRPDAPPA